MSYTISWFTKRKAPVLIRRPWWNVFGRDSIGWRDQWERVTIADITEAESKLLTAASADDWQSPLGALIGRLMQNPYSLQLEHDEPPRPYLATSREP